MLRNFLLLSGKRLAFLVTLCFFAFDAVCLAGETDFVLAVAILMLAFKLAFLMARLFF